MIKFFWKTALRMMIIKCCEWSVYILDHSWGVSVCLPLPEVFTLMTALVATTMLWDGLANAGYINEATVIFTFLDVFLWWKRFTLSQVYLSPFSTFHLLSFVGLCFYTDKYFQRLFIYVMLVMSGREKRPQFLQLILLLDEKLCTWFMWPTVISLSSYLCHVLQLLDWDFSSLLQVWGSFSNFCFTYCTFHVCVCVWICLIARQAHSRANVMQLFCFCQSGTGKFHI